MVFKHASKLWLNTAVSAVNKNVPFSALELFLGDRQTTDKKPSAIYPKRSFPEQV